MEYFIYKIINHDTNKIYYGNTCRSIYLRLKEHKNSYLRFIRGKSKRFVSSYLVLHPDPENVSIILVDKCDNIENARIIEGKYIKNYPCVNFNSSGFLNNKFNILKSYVDSL